jgi:hypothetical protein
MTALEQAFAAGSCGSSAEVASYNGKEDGGRFDMKLIFALALVIGAGCAAAKDYCPRVPEPKVEHDAWYIPEAAFTKQAANKALKELSGQVNDGVSGRDFLIENDLTMIKGYLYRAYLAEHEKAFGSEDSDLKREFCEFLKTKAFVVH